jgi:hypothetical protein
VVARFSSVREPCTPSSRGLLELVEEIVNPVGASPQITDDGAIVGIVLALESPPRGIDAPQTPSDFLPLGIGYPEDAVDRDDGPIVKLAESRLAIAVSYPS